MAENEIQYLASDEPVSSVKSLGHKILILVNKESGKVETILGIGPFGTSEYDKAAGGWAIASQDQTERINNLIDTLDGYVVDWSNNAAFDRKGESLALIKYRKNMLSKAWLEANTIYVGSPKSVMTDK